MKTKLIILLVLFGHLSVISQNFYVDKHHPSASDSNPGTEALPWASIQHAANTATPGSTVHIKAGTYFETIWLNVSGTAGNYITFTNYSSDIVEIDGGSTGMQTVLFAIFNQDYIKVNGLHFQNAIGNYSAGIYIGQGSDFIEITNNKIYNIHFSANPFDPVTPSTNVNPFVVYNELGSDSCSDIIVMGNEIYNCRTGFSESLTLNGNVENFLFSENLIHDVTNIGIDIAGGYGVSSDPLTDMARNGSVIGNTTYNCVSNYAVSAGIYVDGGQNVLVEKNISYQNGRGFEVGCEQIGHVASGITVRNNLAYDNLEAGIGIGGYDFSNGNTGKVTDSEIRNNTFYNNNTSNIWNGELLVEYTENCTIRNNIFSSQNTQNMLVVTRENSIGLVVDYNLYYHPAGTASGKVDHEGAVYTGFTNYQSGSGLDAHSAFANPSFLDAANRDLNIPSTSPARDAGDPAFSSAPVERDFAGNPRISGGIVDIGAYEFQMLLPVEFVDFYVRPAGRFHILKWITGEEHNNHHYEIERSSNNHFFQKIGTVNARNEATSYEFTDKNPVTGLNYYRLRQVDFDGSASYSPIISIAGFEKEIQVFPNPFTDQLQVEYEGPNLSFTIFNAIGKIVSGGILKGEAIDLSSLEAGIYLLRIDTQAYPIFKKVVKK